ncbi:MAG: hypothetical protein QUV10_13910 [Paracoccaceae bacterium]|nr:hypothetical protein [Paracoccaceae bacterium]
MTDNSAEAQLRLRLIAEIEKHMPTASCPYPEGLAFAKPSEFHAERLSDAFKAPLLPFGLGPSEVEWTRVRKAATELQRALIGLGHDGFRELNWQAPLWWEDDKPLGHEGYLVAEILFDAAKAMERKRKAGLKASKKRNWQAAALAKVARQIWAEEEWDSKPETYGRAYNRLADYVEPEVRNALAFNMNYEKHREEFAPRTEKLDALGPFGRFLDGVLKCFGCKISPASALRSLSDAQKALDKVGRTAPKT